MRHMNQPLTQQRIRITFGKLDAMRFIGHLDLAKTWERVLRRARVPVEYTQGFNPRPRLQFAAALPVGVSSESEVLDVWLTARLEGDDAARWVEALNAASPAGLRTYRIAEVPIKADALPTQVTFAEYEIAFDAEQPGAADLRARVESLLAQTSVMRPGHKHPYDLRPRVLALAVDDAGLLHARLSANERANARPDELLDALGLDAARARIHRRALHLTAADALADSKGDA